jgi:hypothetical protein
MKKYVKYISSYLISGRKHCFSELGSISMLELKIKAMRTALIQGKITHCEV